jgi:hypothetical protein
MARLWSCGFELQSIATDVEFTAHSQSGGGTGSIDTTTKRSGAASYRSRNTGSAAGAYGRFKFVSSDSNGTYYARAYVYIADRPDALSTIFGFVEAADSTVRGRIRIATDGTLELWDSAAKIGSSSSALALNTWYRIELSYFNNTGTSKLELNALLDGVSFASTTTSTNTGTVSLLSFGERSGVSSYDYYFDDIALNDSTGSFQNTWPGEGEIIHLKPNATGDNGDWTGGSGGDTGDYQDIDEVTPNDATDFLISNTSGQIEDVNLEATPATMDSSDAINCVSVGIRFRIINATDPDPNAVVRIKATSGGTVEESSNLGNAGTTFVTNAPAAPRLYPLTLYDLPGASTTPWTKADLDTAQIGVRETATDATTFNVTTMWLLVEHKPTAGSSSIKTILGLAKASVKTINGLAIASVKSKNGLT